MAALIVRAMPGWADETGLPTFTDNTADTELMTRVATLQRHDVVRGYQDDVCREQGKHARRATARSTPSSTARCMLFIARAMVAKGYWAFQPDDRTIFPDQNGAAGADPDTDQQTLDHRMVVTYVHYAGAPPDVADVPSAPFAGRTAWRQRRLGRRRAARLVRPRLLAGPRQLLRCLPRTLIHIANAPVPRWRGQLARPPIAHPAADRRPARRPSSVLRLCARTGRAAGGGGDSRRRRGRRWSRRGC